MGWLQLAAGALGVLVVLWIVLWTLARTLPHGVLREAATFLPASSTALRRLLRDPRVPRRAKVVLGVAVVWVVSPIDLVPEFIPIVGLLDDVVVVALALRYVSRHMPRSVLLEAWPGDPQRSPA